MAEDIEKSFKNEEQPLTPSSSPDAQLTKKNSTLSTFRTHDPTDRSTDLDDSTQKPSGFSLALVSKQLGDLWSSAKEVMFGADYWIPSDPYEIAAFPPSLELLAAHPIIMPTEKERKNLSFYSKNEPLFSIRQGRTKIGQPLFHVTLRGSHLIDEQSQNQVLSLFRSDDLHEAIDLYQICLPCHDLFLLLDTSKDVKKAINQILGKLKSHPLWQAVHIAAEMGTEAYFLRIHSEDSDLLSRLLHSVCHPEGLHPLLIAIQVNHVPLVKTLMHLGADPSLTDMCGSNALHYAALASVQMLEVELWRTKSARNLLNTINNDGCTPLFVAIRNANPRCTRTLVGFGAELNIRCKGKSPLFEAMQFKSKSTEVLKSLLDASPSMLNEKDILTGNTALHIALSKEPLMALLRLKHKEMDVNAVNHAKQTALHLHVHRGDLGCVMTLIAFDVQLDVQDKNGNTALHVAAAKDDIVIVRMLLCAGANPNIFNCHGDTARHIAVKLKLKEPEQSSELIRALDICGARRCPAGKVGCRSGCADRATLELLHTSSAANEEDEHSSQSPIEKPETWEFIQNQCYEELCKKLEQNSDWPPVNMLNLLSLDGGGIRGLVIIQLLLAIESLMKPNEKVIDYFDWIAGTSTGALIGIGLTQGKSLREIQRVYLRFKDQIFDGWARPYNTTVLEQFIQREVGVEQTMADLKWPRVMLTTVRADYFPVELEFIRNYRLPLSDPANLELGFEPPSNWPVWKALRCSSAAPTFFSSVEGRYLDGGLIANNPALDLLSEICLWNNTVASQQRPESDRVVLGCMLSMGTGVAPKSPLETTDVEITGNPYTNVRNIGAMRNLGVILVDQVTATEGAPVVRSRCWCHTIGVPFFRFSAPMSRYTAIDTKGDVEVAQMMWDCVEYTNVHSDQMRRLTHLLRLIGPSIHRGKRLFAGTNQQHRD